MNDHDLQSQLLKQAGLSDAAPAALPAHDRAAMWKRIDKANERVRKLKRGALIAFALLAASIVMIIIAKNGPNQDQGIRLVLRYAGSTGAFLGMYGGLLMLATLIFHVISIRFLEMSGRLANMENLLQDVVQHLERLPARMENPNPSPRV